MYGEGAVTMFGDFEDEQEELMVQLAEIDKELEVLVTENQMYENCYQVKAQVRYGMHAAAWPWGGCYGR